MKTIKKNVVFFREAPSSLWGPRPHLGQSCPLAYSLIYCLFQVQRKQEEEAAKKGTEQKEMITVPLRKALEKQGYKLIGSHSGVKLCRWTKVGLGILK